MVVLFGLAGAGWTYRASASSREITACGALPNGSPQLIDCVYNVIKSDLHANGLRSAYGVFAYAYENAPGFASSGCHRHAHWMGDTVYYAEYVAGSQDLSKIDFPPETEACGYGFFHGFLEHLVQDHPSVEFVTTTCSHLSDRLSKEMHDLPSICYHGSGHGLMLGRAVAIKKAQWGNDFAFTELPLKECDALPAATSRHKEECREGIFNVLVEWMETKQYGFHYDQSHPFGICQKYSPLWKRACYYEMAQRLDSISSHDPVKTLATLSEEKDVKLKEMAFQVGVTGMMQSLSGTDKHYEVLSRCELLDAHWFPLCIQSIVAGLFEHGEPLQEYVPALTLCADPRIAARGADRDCWRVVGKKLQRFYGQDKIDRVCTSVQIPAKYVSVCTGKS